MDELIPARLMEDEYSTQRYSVAPLVTHGLLDAGQAERLESVLLTIGTAAADVWSVTRLKRNPGAFMAEVLTHRPQVLADSKRKDAEPIVAISAADLMSLVKAATRAAGPGFATGRAMHARLSRSGAPLEITTQGLPRRHQKRLSIKGALAAHPVASSRDEGA